MAHMISTVSGRAEVFTAGDLPWHGLGVNVPERVTSREAIELAGLNWQVLQKQAEFRYNGDGYDIPDRLVNYRIKNDGIHTEPVYLGTVSPNYQIIQNTEAFEFFDEVIGKNLAIYETAGAIRDGKRVWILAKLPEDLIINTQGGTDITKKYLLFVNGHDGTFSCRMFYTPVRVVCNNTLNAALGKRGTGTGVSIRHRGDMKMKIEQAVQLLGIANEYYQNLGDMFQHMANTKFGSLEARDYFKAIVPDAEDEESKAQTNVEVARYIMTQNYTKGAGNELAGRTVWGAYNAVTQFADHQKFVLRKSGSAHSRFESVVWGSASNLKQKAFDLAAEVVKTAV